MTNQTPETPQGTEWRKEYGAIMVPLNGDDWWLVKDTKGEIIAQCFDEADADLILALQSQLAQKDAEITALREAVDRFWVHDTAERADWLRELWHEHQGGICACEDGKHRGIDNVVGHVFRDINLRGIIAIKNAFSALTPPASEEA